MVADEALDGEQVLKNFVRTIRKTNECTLCNKIMMENVMTHLECENSFCRDCIQQGNNSLEGCLLCPCCKSPTTNENLVDNQKLGAISASIWQFATDFCCEANLDKDKFLGKSTSVRAETDQAAVSLQSSKGKKVKPKSPDYQSPVEPPGALAESPSLQSLQLSNLNQMKLALQNTPEPRQKVHQWLANVDSSTPIIHSDEEEEKSISSKGSKNLSLESSRPSSAGALLEPFQDLIDSGSVLQNTSKRGRGGRARGRAAKKNALPLRSAEKVSASPSGTPPMPKQLFLARTNESSQSATEKDIVANDQVAEGRQDPSTGVETPPSSGSQTTKISQQESKAAVENNVMETSDQPQDLSIPKDPIPYDPAPEEANKLQSPLPIADIEMTPVAVEPEKIAEEVQPVSRLTFSIPTETQDLLALAGPPVETQDLFKMNEEVPVAAAPAEKKHAVTFHFKGRIAPKKTGIVMRKRKTVFVQLGRLRARGKLTEDVVPLAEEPGRNLKPDVRQLPEPRKPVVACQETQTELPLAKSCAETQTNPRPASASVATQTILPSPASIGTQTTGLTSFACQETQTEELQPVEIVKKPESPIQSYPEMPNAASDTARPTSGSAPVTLESDESSGIDFFSFQPPKRSRRLSSDNETQEQSQDAKRRKSTPTKPTTTPTCPGRPFARIQEECQPKTPSTPVTKVLESDNDSEDELVATPTSRRGAERRRISIQRKVFVCSGLPRSQIKMVEDLARQMGAEVLPAYTPNVTHVIVRVDEENCAERTLKFLYGVACKRWIVSIEWIRECVKEGRFVEESRFEVLDMDGQSGPSRARISQSKLFDLYEFCCVEPFTDVTVAQMRELLDLSGAATVPSPADLVKRRPYFFIVVQPEAGFEPRKADQWADTFGAPTVSREWILDCIASYQIGSVKEHLVGRKSEVLLMRMGFDLKLLK